MLRKILNLFNPVIMLIMLVLIALAFSIAAPFAMAQSNRETWLYASKTYDPGSVSSASQTTTTVTVETAALGDWCSASLGVSTGGLTVQCAITAANTATVTLTNNTGGAVDLASSLLRVRVVSHPPYLR